VALGRVGAQAEEEDFAGAFPILDEAQVAKLNRYGVEERTFRWSWHRRRAEHRLAEAVSAARRRRIHRHRVGPGRDGGWTPLLLETSQPGIFAVGDVRHGSIKRVATAVGEGAMVVRLVHERLHIPSSEMKK
jgi:NADPH-dependent glutamate synthase beta subunit-like oxidoreductase